MATRTTRSAPQAFYIGGRVFEAPCQPSPDVNSDPVPVISHLADGKSAGRQQRGGYRAGQASEDDGLIMAPVVHLYAMQTRRLPRRCCS